MPNATNCGVNPVLALELDRNGNVSKKTMKLDREAQLTNSLLQGLYPGIHVATVDVPTEPLDSCEQAMVEQALAVPSPWKFPVCATARWKSTRKGGSSWSSPSPRPLARSLNA